MDISGILEAEDKLLQADKAEEVEQLLMGGISVALEEQDSAALLHLLNELLSYYRDMEKFDEAFKVAEEIKQLSERILPQDSIPYASSLLNIASAYRAGGRTEDALDIYLAVEKIYDRILPENSMLRVSLCNSESLLFQENGNYEASKAVLCRTLKIANAAGEDYEAAVAESSLAGICMQLGELDEGQQYAFEAISIFEKIEVRDEHYTVALSALGSYYYICGKFDEAAGIFKTAMDVMEESLGKNAFYDRLEENYKACLAAAGESKEGSPKYQSEDKFEDKSEYGSESNSADKLIKRESEDKSADDSQKQRDIQKGNLRPVTLVTGASRGIGKAIAHRLAKEGYDLVITCSASEQKLAETAMEIENTYGVKCIPVVADAADFEQVSRIFELPIIRENGLDLLVNNAGISYVGLLHEMTPDEWRRVMSVNLDSVFNTCHGAVPVMLKKHSGRIINISSVWGNVGASMEVAYSASKGGINSFTRALAKELAPSGITVNAVACGLIDTQMNACFSSEDLQSVIDEIPADRIGKPEEVADLVYRVATGPDYLTGQIITIDGGWI